MRGAAHLAASQRRARRRMLLRGQITIAIGLGTLGLLLWTAIAGVGGDASAEPQALAALPDVGAFDVDTRDAPTPDADPVEPVLPEPASAARSRDTRARREAGAEVGAPVARSASAGDRPPSGASAVARRGRSAAARRRG